MSLNTSYHNQAAVSSLQVTAVTSWLSTWAFHPPVPFTALSAEGPAVALRCPQDRSLTL